MGCDSYEVKVILFGNGATYQYACNNRLHNEDSRKIGGW